MTQSGTLRLAFGQPMRNLKTVAVIGSGLMGSGIAEVSVRSGYVVHLVDVSEQALSKAVLKLDKNLTRFGEKKFPQDKDAATTFLTTCLSNLKTSTDLRSSVSDADLVIEAIVEKLESKHDLFRQLNQYCTPDCLLASNTSSLSLRAIGSVIDRPDVFGGLHFFNPVPVLKLVEVGRTAETSDSTFQALMQFARSLDKFPVVCRDTPGFIVNRLLMPYLVEAMFLVERGDATAADVDQGMRLGAGYPMGPFELADFVGLDTIKLICDSLSSGVPGHPSLACPSTLTKLVSEGKFGRKSGQGFFTYDAQGNRVVAA